MTSTTTKPDSSQPTAEMAVDLFDNWFDPIETEVRARAREFIEEMIRGELDTVLARPRYSRSQMAGKPVCRTTCVCTLAAQRLRTGSRNAAIRRGSCERCHRARYGKTVQVGWNRSDQRKRRRRVRTRVHGEFVNYAAIGIWNRPRPISPSFAR